MTKYLLLPSAERVLQFILADRCVVAIVVGHIICVALLCLVSVFLKNAGQTFVLGIMPDHVLKTA